MSKIVLPLILMGLFCLPAQALTTKHQDLVGRLRKLGYEVQFYKTNLASPRSFVCAMESKGEWQLLTAARPSTDEALDDCLFCIKYLQIPSTWNLVNE